jgi:hypothetical protein
MSTSPTLRPGFTATGKPRNPSNRLGLDYRREAEAFVQRPRAILDAHLHLAGPGAVRIFREAASLYGVGKFLSMTPLELVPAVQDELGDDVRFIAVPNYFGSDRRHEHGPGFLEAIEAFHSMGSRVVKFWSAPRGLDYGRESGAPDLLRLDSANRLEAMRLAASLDMTFMVHVADPDTWFATRYADASLYGTKASHYEPLRRMLDRFEVPWIAAHCGGWPEDLDFLDTLLDAHPNLSLDISATKWVVREISRHPRDRVVRFFARWRGRLLFGSDIVTHEDHLRGGEKTEMGAKASDADSAFDLYASRYWAYRTMLETEWTGESPIADPDLAAVEPSRFSAEDAPTLRGLTLPEEILGDLYHEAARRLFEDAEGDEAQAPASASANRPVDRSTA